MRLLSSPFRLPLPGRVLPLVCAVLFMTAACGGGDPGPLGECPPNSQNRQDFGASVLYITCTGCHSASLEGAARQGAPVGTDYDTPEQVLAQAEDILQWVQSGTMPPPDGLNADQMENVRIYLACGAVQ